MADAIWVDTANGVPYLDLFCDCDPVSVSEARTPAADAPLWRPGSLAETDLAARLGVEYLKGRYVAWGRSRWSRWTGQVWQHCDEAEAYGAMRAAVGSLVDAETAAANRALEGAMTAASRVQDEDRAKSARAEATAEHARRMKALRNLFWVGRIKTLLQGAREVLYVRYEDFDTHRDLLNVANGVVNLQTGELAAHDPELMFTKISPTRFVPGAEHADWAAALSAMPDDVADWMKVRFGQAATGYAASDDVVPFLFGGGGNGKSSVLAGVIGALGKAEGNGYATIIPDKVLLGSQNDHPTELMTLKGARFGYIEELPEGDFLNAVRLKKAAGTDGMTARYIGQDSVSWTATHSLMVTTNHQVRIDAVDNGTWRRLALVNFPVHLRRQRPRQAEGPHASPAPERRPRRPARSGPGLAGRRRTALVRGWPDHPRHAGQRPRRHRPAAPRQQQGSRVPGRVHGAR
ncbi:phage/plasmid primase, P4 family [Streptomyces sp. LHD-70]|uniref:phage/plasmid primase, P4 family n=1 Tax=Streptomyces sp. LHD-70 TaxID=3072140 RepID=UPI00280C70A0|nr:phage/plasmid primase, P4 family [Streptomyces sp. LHD-70]MDQ8706764.1 phage/plasmid primase, P4 family [Streptomyces sp. LHD-70]